MLYASRSDVHRDVLKWICILALALFTAMLLAGSLGGGASMI